MQFSMFMDMQIMHQSICDVSYNETTLVSGVYSKVLCKISFGKMIFKEFERADGGQAKRHRGLWLQENQGQRLF